MTETSPAAAAVADIPDYEKLAPQELDQRRSLLTAAGLPEYCANAFAEYHTLQELAVKLATKAGVRASEYDTALLAKLAKSDVLIPKAFRADTAADAPLGGNPTQILWDTLKLGENVQPPDSVDFARLFIDLSRSKGNATESLIKQRSAKDIIVSREKDFPLTITPERFQDMIYEPTPDAARMLALALRETLRSTSTGRAKLNEIRKDPDKYLAGLAATAQPRQTAQAETEVDAALVGRALRSLRKARALDDGNEIAVTNIKLADKYNSIEKRAAAAEHRGEILLGLAQAQSLLEGKPAKDEKKYVAHAVGLANILLLPPEKRPPEVNEVLGGEEKFTSVRQLEELGARLKAAAKTASAAKG